MHRFYVDRLDATDRSISLDGSIARQLKKVLRADVADHIRLFDGSGSEWEVEIDHVVKTRFQQLSYQLFDPLLSQLSK